MAGNEENDDDTFDNSKTPWIVICLFVLFFVLSMAALIFFTFPKTSPKEIPKSPAATEPLAGGIGRML